MFKSFSNLTLFLSPLPCGGRVAYPIAKAFDDRTYLHHHALTVGLTYTVTLVQCEKDSTAIVFDGRNMHVIIIKAFIFYKEDPGGRVTHPTAMTMWVGSFLQKRR